MGVMRLISETRREIFVRSKSIRHRKLASVVSLLIIKKHRTGVVFVS